MINLGLGVMLGINFNLATVSLPAPVSSYDYPTVAANVGLPSGFTTLPATGWMAAVCRSTVNPVGSANQSILTLSDGTSANTFGIRYIATTGRPQPYIRCNSVSQSGPVDNFNFVQNVQEPYILTWNNNGSTIDYKMYYQGRVTSRNTTLAAFTANFTSFHIGSRNAGGDPITGTVSYAEIGSGTYLTDIQLAALAMRMVSQPIFVIGGGQSNQANFVDGVETSAPSGRDALMSILNATTSSQVLYLHGAAGGSSVLKDAASSGDLTNYWWNPDTNSAGPMLGAWYAVCQEAGVVPNDVLWDQGEAESHKIDHPSFPTVTRAAYKAGMLSVFNWMRSKNPLLNVGIVQLGIRTSGYTSTYKGIQTVVDVQNEIIAENSWAYFAYARHDLQVFTDGVHYYDAAYTTMGQRGARAILRRNGVVISGGTLGPRLVSATRSGVTVTVNLTHDGGTDFTPTTGIEGFAFVRDSDGTVFTPSAAVRATATSVTLTLPSDPSTAGKVYYIYDNVAISSLSNVLKDNGANALPLQRGFVSCN